jgi:hypothetical protein
MFVPFVSLGYLPSPIQQHSHMHAASMHNGEIRSRVGAQTAIPNVFECYNEEIIVMMMMMMMIPIPRRRCDDEPRLEELHKFEFLSLAL